MCIDFRIISFFFLLFFRIIPSSVVTPEKNDSSYTTHSALPVFPGAVGFGSETIAGRGGMVIKVTNLNAAGNGSLKAALDLSIPRVVIFEVAGTIELHEDLFIRNPYITLAGQSAPSPGITIRGASITILTHDVLIQHIRIRVGDDQDGPAKEDRDALKIHNNYKQTHNVIIDHCSFSWSIDENVSIAHPGIYNVSLLNCIISEGLYIAGHPEYPEGTPHSKGLMTGPGVTNVTIYGNLFAHNHQRNIQVGDPSSKNIEEVNNLIYNWGSTAADTYGDLNVIGNLFIAGPDTEGPSIQTRSRQAKLYASDNIGAVWRQGSIPSGEPVTHSGIAESEIMPSSKVYDYVIHNSGSRPSDRDDVDKRIIHEVKSGTGSFKNSVAEAGGWPDLGQHRRSVNMEIPGVGPIPSKPKADRDGDGYTDVEEWLHKLSSMLDLENNKCQQ